MATFWASTSVKPALASSSSDFEISPLSPVASTSTVDRLEAAAA